MTHNLLMLAKKGDLELTEQNVEHLAEINTFNIEARYPDDKFRFYKKCTVAFTEKHIKIIKEFRHWLETKL